MSFVEKTFTAEIQNSFAELSGDHNPIHCDPVFARKTLPGGQVVHGMHQVLTVLDALFCNLEELRSPRSFLQRLKVSFARAVLVGDTITFSLVQTADQYRVTGKNRQEIVSRMSFDFGDASLPAFDNTLDPVPVHAVEAPNINDVLGMKGSLQLGLDYQQAEKLFPSFLHVFGPIALAELLGVSRLVGMHCPGLHSLLSRVDLTFLEASMSSHVLGYGVATAEPRFGNIEMELEGPSIRGRVSAIFLPQVQQPEMNEVAKNVESTAFSASAALIIGGSRGLGELTAKIITSGGGTALITYHQGQADAENVATQIRAFGRVCHILSLDVRDMTRTIRSVFESANPPHSVYYFATPKIEAHHGSFGVGLYRHYQEYYVEAFATMLDAIEAATSEEVQIFYPSTIFVTEGSQDFLEYQLSKKAGEDLCSLYNQRSKKLKVHVVRLPKIMTDQTLTLLGREAVDGLDVMLPLIEEVEAGTKRSNIG